MLLNSSTLLKSELALTSWTRCVQRYNEWRHQPVCQEDQTIYGLAYHATTTKQNRTKHSARTNVFKSALLVSKSGPYMGLKQFIESSVDAHLQEVEVKLLDKWRDRLR